jgi:hypothetical protein
VFAVAFDPFEHSTGLGRWADETWCIESHHGLANERCSERTGSPMSGISVLHLSAHFTPLTESVE